MPTDLERTIKIYLEPRDWWIGYYRGDAHHYVCPLPCLVIRWARRLSADTSGATP